MSVDCAFHLMYICPKKKARVLPEAVRHERGQGRVGMSQVTLKHGRSELAGGEVTARNCSLRNRGGGHVGVHRQCKPPQRFCVFENYLRERSKEAVNTGVTATLKGKA